MKPINKNLFFILFTVVILSSIIVIKEVEATQVIILKPTEGQQFNGLNYGDSIVFRFDIYGYYEWYKTYIDGQLDQCLHQQGEDIYYDAKSFIDRHGRGIHTFDVSVSTGGPGPFGVTGFEIESVTFTVNPPLCHFLGFGYDAQDDFWRSDVLTLQVFLRKKDMQNIYQIIVMRLFLLGQKIQ